MALVSVQGATIVRAARAKVDSLRRRCAICLDDFQWASMVSAAASAKYNRNRTGPCHPRICAGCASQYVANALSEVESCSPQSELTLVTTNLSFCKCSKLNRR